MNLIATVREPEIARIHGALVAGGGVVTVAADTAQEAIRLRKLAVASLDDSWSIGELDVTRCVSTRDLALQFARAVSAMSISDPTALDLPDEQLTAEQRAELAELANTAGARLLRGARGDVGGHDDLREYQELIGGALDALTRRAAGGHRALLAIDGADELLEPPRKSRARFAGAGELMWLIRGRLQHALVKPTLTFAGGPATSDLISGRDAGLLGWGTDIIVDRPPPARLYEAVVRLLETEAAGPASETAREIAAAVVDIVDSSVPTAERLLVSMPDVSDRASMSHGTATTVRRAWALLLELNADALRQTARAVASLDRLALAVARAIAEGRPPYAVPEAPHGSEVAKALASLRIAGFATAPQKGAWRLTDPLFAAWLKQPRASGRISLEPHDLRHIG